ncbi:MAG: hypothetical protein K9M94_13355 [Spirochaetia bacterium]|nr:hypothetical protein [Spirochaetia bacterium]
MRSVSDSPSRRQASIDSPVLCSGFDAAHRAGRWALARSFSSLGLSFCRWALVPPSAAGRWPGALAALVWPSGAGLGGQPQLALKAKACTDSLSLH